VLEQVEQDLKVSLVDRARARAILVSFCSNHDSGTALPPPSVGGLRRKGPVTWPFAPSRPAPSRRPRAATHGSGAARRRARARAHTPSGRRIFSSCPCSPPFSPLAWRPQVAGRARLGHPAGTPCAEVRGPCRRFGPVRSPSERSHRLPDAPSAPPPEVPGFGAVRSLVRLTSQTVAPAMSRISARCPNRSPVARQPLPSDACSRPSGGLTWTSSVVCSIVRGPSPHSVPIRLDPEVRRFGFSPHLVRLEFLRAWERGIRATEPRFLSGTRARRSETGRNSTGTARGLASPPTTARGYHASTATASPLGSPVPDRVHHPYKGARRPPSVTPSGGRIRGALGECRSGR
jgi:hypothetical protein